LIIKSKIKIFKSVKAIIYRDDGKILMQRRDINKNIPYGGRWTFFGGGVKTKEKLKQALKRELKEELNYSPISIKSKIFEWTWIQKNKKDLNYFYPIHCKNNTKFNTLNEGLEMKWFSPKNFLYYLTTPDIYENFNKICKFLIQKNYIASDFYNDSENFMIKKNSICKKKTICLKKELELNNITNQEFYIIKNLRSFKT
jgi:8-oxo-dGTP diphosphatase